MIYRNELEPDEYEETKEETMEQLKELNDSLTKLVNGNLSLISALGAVQLVSIKAQLTYLLMYPLFYPAGHSSCHISSI